MSGRESCPDKLCNIEIGVGVDGVELNDCYILSVNMSTVALTFQTFAKNSKILENNGWAIDAHSIRTNTFANSSTAWIVATFHQVKRVD